MSLNSHNFWQFMSDDPPHYHTPPNYYVSSNITHPHWYEDPYSCDFNVTMMNYHMKCYYYYYYYCYYYGYYYYDDDDDYNYYYDDDYYYRLTRRMIDESEFGYDFNDRLSEKLIQRY